MGKTENHSYPEGDTRPLERMVADYVEAQRQARGWTYQELADKLLPLAKMHPSAIQKSVKGLRRITIDELNAYAEAFGVTVSELLDDSLYSATWGADSEKIAAAAIGLAERAEKTLSRQIESLRQLRDESATAWESAWSELNALQQLRLQIESAKRGIPIEELGATFPQNPERVEQIIDDLNRDG